MRRWLIRLGIVVGFIVICFLLYSFGKQYEIFVDNKTVTISETTYEAKYAAVYNIDDSEETEIKLKKRKKSYVVGPNHVFVLKYVDENGKDVEIKKEFNLSTDRESLIVNIPVLIEGGSEWLIDK